MFLRATRFALAAKKAGSDAAAKARRPAALNSGWLLFVKETYAKDATLKTQFATFADRTKELHARWTSLSAAQQDEFNVRAKNTPVPAVPKRSDGKNWGSSPWKEFVKANYKTVAKLPFKERLAALRVKFLSEQQQQQQQK